MLGQLGECLALRWLPWAVICPLYYLEKCLSRVGGKTILCALLLSISVWNFAVPCFYAILIEFLKSSVLDFKELEMLWNVGNKGLSLFLPYGWSWDPYCHWSGLLSTSSKNGSGCHQIGDVWIIAIARGCPNSVP